MNNPAGVYFFMTVNLSRELSSFCNCNLSSSEAVSILLLMESFISCNALSTSLLKNLAIKVTLSLLVLGSKSKSTLACSSMEEILGVSKELLSAPSFTSSLGDCSSVELRAAFNISATLFLAGSLLPLLPATLSVLILLSINHCLNCLAVGLSKKGLFHSLALLSVAFLPVLSASVAKYTVPSEFLTLSSVLPV